MSLDDQRAAWLNSVHAADHAVHTALADESAPRRVLALQDRVASLQAQVAALREAVRVRDQLLEDQRAAVAERDTVIAGHHAVLAERDRLLADHRVAVAERDARIDQLTSALGTPSTQSLLRRAVRRARRALRPVAAVLRR